MPWQITRKPGSYRVDLTLNLDAQGRPAISRVFLFDATDARLVDQATGQPLAKAALVTAMRQAVKDQVAAETSPPADQPDVLGSGAGAI